MHRHDVQPVTGEIGKVVRLEPPGLDEPEVGPPLFGGGVQEVVDLDVNQPRGLFQDLG